MTAHPQAIDPAAVTALLAAHVAPGLRCQGVTRAAVGNGQETWFVDAVDEGSRARSYVLRRSAVAGVLDDTDRRHEFDTLRAVQDAGLPTPRAYWLEMQPSTLQRPFFIMDRMPGRPPAPASAAEAAAIARDLGRLLARLHSARTIPSSAGDTFAATAGEIARWKARYFGRRPAPVPLIGALLAWLEVNIPGEPRPARLLWGDAGPHNILVQDGHVSAMLDWELSHTGHPLEDVGAAIWACLGRYPENEVIAGYEELSGETLDRDLLAYFAVLGCVSRTIMQLAGVDSFVRGETSALNLAGLGLSLPPANLRRAAVYAGWPGFSDWRPVDPPEDDSMRMRPDVTETLEGIARFLSEEVIPQAASAHVRRGLKTATGLLAATARRARDEPGHRRELTERRDALFARLEEVGAAMPGDRRDAEALEAAAVRVELEPAFSAVRDDVRRALLSDFVMSTSWLDPLIRLYGRDVQTGTPFSR